MGLPSKDQILKALQWNFFNVRNPVNGDAGSSAAWEFTYSFDDKRSQFSYDDGTASEHMYSGFTTWTEAEKNTLREAMAHIETFANVTFREVSASSDADIDLGVVNLPGTVLGEGGFTGWYYTEDPDTIGYVQGFAVFDRDYNLAKDKYSVGLHELGHVLGLRHSFDSDILSGKQESTKYTLMSYTSNPETGKDPDMMGLFDVYALQDIWGAAEYNTGDTAYTGSRGRTTDTIWDTGGTDEFDASGYSTRVVLNLNEGRFSKFSGIDDVVIAFGVEIENATGGAGNDKLIGNALANVLHGGGGKDKILGKGGNDALYGEGGANVLVGGAGEDDLYAERGRNTLKGGADSDLFIFSGGKATVKDFEDGVDFVGVIGFGGEGDILELAYRKNGNLIFDFGDGDRLVLKDTKLADFSDADLFV